MCVCVCVCVCMYVYIYIKCIFSLVAQTVKNLLAVQETWVQSLGWEDPLEEGMAIPFTPVFLPGKFHGQGSLAGYSSWGHRVRHD